MADGQVLSLAVSGLRFSGRTELYQQLELVLPKRSLRGCDFVFLGNPFGHLRHPLQWVRDGHKKYGVARLLECWAMLDEFTEDKWLPAVREKKIPIMDGCGLDAVLYATACLGCSRDDQVLEWHYRLVDGRLRGQGIAPPRYIVTASDYDSLLPRLRAEKIIDPTVDDTIVRHFIEKERATIDGYFTHQSQFKPYTLPSGISSAERLERAIAFIDATVSVAKAA